MTTTNPPKTKLEAADDTVFLDCLVRIFRTSRIETTEPLSKHFAKYPMIKRQGMLVQANEQKDKTFHF